MSIHFVMNQYSNLKICCITSKRKTNLLAHFSNFFPENIWLWDGAPLHKHNYTTSSTLRKKTKRIHVMSCVITFQEFLKHFLSAYEAKPCMQEIFEDSVTVYRICVELEENLPTVKVSQFINCLGDFYSLSGRHGRNIPISYVGGRLWHNCMCTALCDKPFASVAILIIWS